ncbi:MAG: c-type cytochrome [Planctomycetia bacterium]|nr:c-type cytochrome [Planctomycetia bacterium]
MTRFPLFAVALILFCSFAASLAAQDPFAAGVRPTDALSPQDELKALQVPEGFEVQFVASEPDIFKPMNMAFDERGRMWITDSLEYPWAAPLDKPGRDSVKILHDTDGDGKADVIKTFADGLNIPIGIYPYPSRKDEASGKTIQGAIVYSIPFIWDLRDTDGDDICDERIKLYGPFGYERDTHGMCNAFRRGFDGWIYACHGFNNISKVAGKDGHVVEMSSGNTFRFRMDGSRIEHFSHGQVNPFGMCFDPLFNIFTADCHTKPITQILRGAYYQSFGKPHDGLGYVPEIMSHTHGTTANCGIVAYYGGHFPKEWEGMFFTGNVMTSRVNVDAPEYHGSTILAKERPDFVISKDPWFRPVDLQCGPDGALYILDFYNKIIGHYEVDLKHPGRDRHRGRIWKVVHKATPPFKMPDLRHTSREKLVELLGHSNFKIRSLVYERLLDKVVWTRVDAKTVATGVTEDGNLFELLEDTLTTSKNAQARTLAYSLLHQAFQTHLDLVVRVANDPAPEVRVMMMKLDTTSLIKHADISRVWLADENPFVRRAAAEAFGTSPHASHVSPLLEALAKTPEEDHHLRQVIRIALRDTLTSPGVFSDITESEKDQATSIHLANIALAVKTPKAADFLIEYLRRDIAPPETLLPIVQHAARFASTASSSALVAFVRSQFKDDVTRQLDLLNTLRSATEQRGEKVDASLRDWASELAGKLLESSRGASLSWANEVVPGKPKAGNPWELRARVSQDGDKGSLFYDSLVKGEQLTGLYRSEPFELPGGKFSFWCAGHNGVPGTPFNPKNFIRLRDASTHALLREAMPPRNDTAQKIEWDLTEVVGKRGYVELLDADEGSGFAWLAVGRFSIAGLNPSDVPSQQVAAANLVADFKIADLKSQITERLLSHDTDARAKEAFARALLALQPDTVLASLVPLIADVSLPEALREQIAAAVIDRRLVTLVRPESTSKDKPKEETGKSAHPPLLLAAVKAIPERLQLRLAETLASDAIGANELLRFARDGHVSPRLLTRPTIKQRLDAIKSDDLHKQVAEVTSGLPNEDEALRKMIEQRRTTFLSAQSNADVTQRPSLELGTALFTKHCAVCHQVAGKGVLVGPQLDGIGQRGLERVLEDVLDPNRNVDVNFRTTTVVTKDGKIFSGLLRREEGATLILVDNKGKEFTVPVADIDERVKSNLSLMPANVHEVVNEREFLDLVSYLLSQRQKAE